MTNKDKEIEFKHKKKRSSHDNDKSISTESTVTVTPGKKKKKRKKENTDVLEFNEEISSTAANVTVTPEKKKRKTETTDLSELSKKNQSERISSTDVNVTVMSEKKKRKKGKTDSSEPSEKNQSEEISSIDVKEKKSGNEKNVKKDSTIIPSNASEPETSRKKTKVKKKRPAVDSNSLGAVDNNLVKDAEKNLQINGMDIESESTAVAEEKEKSKKSRKKKKKKKSAKQAEESSEKKSDQNSNGRLERALNYLHTWNSDKTSWKFNKMNQTVLFHKMYDTSAINEDDFQILLLYLAGMKGKAKEVTHNQAMNIVNGEMEKGEDISAVKEQRAREVVQLLS